MSNGQKESFSIFLSQYVQRKFHLETISTIQEERQVKAEMEKLLKKKTWIDYATVIEWEHWINEELKKDNE